MRLRVCAGCCLLLALQQSCQCRESTRPAVEAVAPASPRVAGAALAQRVCSVLQREPAQRRQQCCGGDPERHLASECQSALAPALERGSLSIDAAALEACARASAEQQQGCSWVTPGQPLPPAACQGLTRGRLSAGATCRSALECQSPLHCAGSTPSEPGRCALPGEEGSACATQSDPLAALLFSGDLERAHPSCSGSCSLLTRRCEAASAAAAQRSSGKAASRQTAGSGEACQSDFDCASGGCSAGRCGMKCSVTLAPPSAQGRALAFRRRAAQ